MHARIKKIKLQKMKNEEMKKFFGFFKFYGLDNMKLTISSIFP